MLPVARARHKRCNVRRLVSLLDKLSSLSCLFWARTLWQRIWRTVLRGLFGGFGSKIMYGSAMSDFFLLRRTYYVRGTTDNRVVQTRHGNLVFLQPKDNVFIYDEIFGDKCYEKFRKICTSDIVVDVGAHVGVFSIKAASQAKCVLAIEPCKFNFELLVKNIRANHADNVTAVNAAVFNYNGTVNLFMQGNSGMHSTVKRSREAIPVTAVKLDRLLEESRFGKVTFLKIDTEGAEKQVLEGASHTITRYRPYIVMEYHTPEDKDVISNTLDTYLYTHREEDTYIYATPQ